MMNKVVKFLQENPVQYLATVGRDGKAKCRPFMFASVNWMASYGSAPTTRKKSTKICRLNPFCRSLCFQPGVCLIRLNGEAVF